MAAQLSDENQKMVVAVLTFFYPGSPPRTINEQLADLAARMLKTALEASNAMDFVPRPAGSKPGITWLFSNIVKAFWRSAAQQKIYDTVRVATARNFRSEYAIAKAGR